MRNATQTNTAVLGILAGLAGIEHGVGEILQGSQAPTALVIRSWPDAPAMEIVNGEPALTVVPNLLITGILAILFSLLFIAWATLFIQRRGGLILMLLCIPMLLFGAGFGPPILGAIIGAAAARIPAPSTGRGLPPTASRNRLGRLWPLSLGACLAAWLAMMPGAVLLNHFWGITNANLILALLLAMFSLLFLTILTASARDTHQIAPAG